MRKIKAKTAHTAQNTAVPTGKLLRTYCLSKYVRHPLALTGKNREKEKKKEKRAHGIEVTPKS